MHLDQRQRGRDAPAGEAVRHAGLERIGGAVRLDLAPAGAAGAGDVDAEAAGLCGYTALRYRKEAALAFERNRLIARARALLPEVRDSSAIYGESMPGLLGAAIPIAGIAGDQQAATFGQACLTPGMAKNTYGTGCFLLMNTGPQPVPSKNRLVTTEAWKAGGKTDFALEGSIFIAGAAVLELPKLGAGVERVGMGPLVLSCITALVGGMVAIKVLVRVLERGAFYRFAPYCWLIGVGTILWALRS